MSQFILTHSTNGVRSNIVETVLVKIFKKPLHVAYMFGLVLFPVVLGYLHIRELLFIFET